LGQPGANNRPPDTATAVCTSDTVDSTNRRPMATPSAAIAVIASANPPPAASGITGSASTARNHTVNTDRTASPRSAKRRNQPRTVSPERPNPTAIRRNPAPPAAFAANADTITAAVSARRTNTVNGNNTTGNLFMVDGVNNTHSVGIGEPSTVPTAAAIANAVSHAIGARIRSLPITPESVLAALDAKRSAGAKA